MLHFDLKINDRKIGRVEAVRREEKIPGDGICTYDVKVYRYRTESWYPEREYGFVVKHIRDEGVFELVAKIMDKVWAHDHAVTVPVR